MLSIQSVFNKLTILFLFVFVLVGCGNGAEDEGSSEDLVKYTRFRGTYKSFDDLQELHMEAAQRLGIKPMETRADTSKYVDKLIKLPMELDMYKIDPLKHSVPFLVEDASKLLVEIGLNFKDSLHSKNMGEYKIIVTSVTRTQDDVASLTKRNRNASENSVHCYATTFDVSWRRFEKVAPEGIGDVSEEKLKLVLAEVLHDLRQRKRCYVVHERKQACFHITVR